MKVEHKCSELPENVLKVKTSGKPAKHFFSIKFVENYTFGNAVKISISGKDFVYPLHSVLVEKCSEHKILLDLLESTNKVT